MTPKKGGRPATGRGTKTVRGDALARATLGPTERQAAHETIVATVRARVAEMTAEELTTEYVRGQFRPLLAAFVRQELRAALRPKRSNRSGP
jgi:hypothetical protein